MKRHRSPAAEGEGRIPSKLSKTSSERTATESETDQPSEDHQQVDISVSLRSATKAARNDPKPPMSFNEERQPDPRVSSPPQAIEDTETPPGPYPAQGSSLAADDRPAPTLIPRQPSREGSPGEHNDDDDSERDDELEQDDDFEQDDDSELDYDHYEVEDDSEDLGLWDNESVDEFPWCEELDGLATLKQSTDMPTISREERQVGGCNAKLIRRGMICESFWLDMEEPAQETSDLAFDLFDRYGRLNPELYEHDVNKGTGVWGKELDRGDLLLFEHVSVDAAHRRRGIGTKLVNAILEKTKKKVSERVGFFALVCPGFLRSEVSHLEDNSEARKQAEEDSEKGALAFWHALGFRRVGTTLWLAWTDSPGHPSRQLGIDQDWTHPDDPTANVSLSSEMERAFQTLADPAIRAAECIGVLKKTFPENFEDGQWQTTDQDGNTLLHIAAMACKPGAVVFLFSNVASLAAVRNKKGYTALEALRHEIELVRSRRSIANVTLVTSDAFDGFNFSTITCLATLEHETVFGMSRLSSPEIEAVYLATEDPSQPDVAGVRKMMQYQYGCTCGQCIGGFLSPRMKLALICVAEIAHDHMNIFMDETGPEWVADNHYLLTHLPVSVRENLETNKSMRQGFANMFSHFAKCLHQGKKPSERNVLELYEWQVRESEWPPVTRNFLQRGGSVAAAANAIFERAMEEDEWAGDASHRDIFGADIDALVACRNDHEFGFVAGTCGYKRVRPASSRFVDMSGRELGPRGLGWSM